MRSSLRDTAQASSNLDTRTLGWCGLTLASTALAALAATALLPCHRCSNVWMLQDDCWQSCTGHHGGFHDKDTGQPIVNTTLFPSLGAMVEHGHAQGVKVGFYQDNCRCNECTVHVGPHSCWDQDAHCETRALSQKTQTARHSLCSSWRQPAVCLFVSRV